MKSAALFLTVAALLGAATLGARSAPAGGTYYTAAQAAAGSKAYQANCSRCHGVRLEGVSGPPLKGVAMHGTQSVAEIYSFMRQQMPVGAPGTLSDGTYVSIVAFLLQQNGHPAGPAPLTPAAAQKMDLKI